MEFAHGKPFREHARCHGGAIAGVTLGLVMVIFECTMLRRLAERKQFMGTIKFALFLPPGFALLAWMFWG